MAFVFCTLSAIPVFAQIKTYTDQQGIKYKVNDRFAVVIGYDDSKIVSTKITIPTRTIDIHYDVPVITIDRAFENCSKLTEVTISEGVTTIISKAFANCTGLTKISIPKSVTTIGGKVFQNCSSLTEVTIPEGVTVIDDYTFYGCTGLTKVSIPKTVTSIGSRAFDNCNFSIRHNETNIAVKISDIPDQTYIGSAIEPEITIVDGDTKIALTLGTDYTIRYFNNIESGTATVIITGIGDYNGMDIRTFDINRIVLAASNVSVIPDQTYTGSTLTPSVTVKDGDKTLLLETDYTVKYSDNINVGTSATVTIKGKGNYKGTVEKTFKIIPKVTNYGALTLTEDQDGNTATLNGNYTTDNALLTLNQDITVTSVTFDRTFTPDATSTIILPFAVESGNYEGGTFYEFISVDYENGKWVASLTKVAGNLTAHKPYLFVPTDNTLTIKGGVKFTATSAEEYADTKGDWTFKGVFKKKDWETGVRTDYFFASASATSTEGNAVNAGDFVRIGNECHLSPFRCYLSYSASGSEQSLLKSAKELPSSIEIRLIDVVTPVSEITPDSDIKVWSFDGTIFIEAQPNMDYTIVDISGRTLKNGVTHSTREEVSLSRRAAGIVIVKIDNKTFKISY